MISIDSYVVKRSIEHYGKDVQSTVCMEECAELIQAISKEKRGKSDKDHLAEEMADVIICIEMLKQIYNITEDEIYSWVITKQERIIRRIEKDTQSTKTNAERIRNMTDDELAEWLTNMCDFEKDEEHYKSIYNLETEELGVRAHIQHLQAYATKEELTAEILTIATEAHPPLIATDKSHVLLIQGREKQIKEKTARENLL